MKMRNHNYKLAFRPNQFSAEELFQRIVNKTIYVPDDFVEEFANELLEAFYIRDRQLDEEDE